MAWRQVITWTNVHLLSIRPLGTKLCEIRIKNTKRSTHEYTYENIVCEMAAIMSRGRWVDYDNEHSISPDCVSADDVNICYACLWNLMFCDFFLFRWVS